MIPEFLPPEARDHAVRHPGVRTALGMAVLVGVPMYLLDGDRSINPTAAAAIHAVTALVFGFLFVWSMRAMERRRARRAYRADPRIVPAPPPGEYEYRFPCAYQPAPLVDVGGHLYLGPREWTFVPHGDNPPEHRAPFSLAAVPPPAVEAVEVGLAGWARMMAPPRPTHLLRVRTRSAVATFVVPEPRSTAARLREYLQTARPSA